MTEGRLDRAGRLSERTDCRARAGEPHPRRRTPDRDGRVGYLATQVFTIAVYLFLARLITPTEMGDSPQVPWSYSTPCLKGDARRAHPAPGCVEEAAATAMIATITAGVVFALAGLAVSPLIGLFFDSRTVGLPRPRCPGSSSSGSSAVVPEALLQRRFSFLLDSSRTRRRSWRRRDRDSRSRERLGVWALVAERLAGVVTQPAAAWVLVRWRPDLHQAPSPSGGTDRLRKAHHRRRPGPCRHVPFRRRSSWAGTSSTQRFVSFQVHVCRIAQRPLAALVSSVTYVVFPA